MASLVTGKAYSFELEATVGSTRFCNQTMVDFIPNTMLSIEEAYLLEEMPGVSNNKTGSILSDTWYVTLADVCNNRAGSILFNDTDLAIADNYHWKSGIGWT